MSTRFISNVALAIAGAGVVVASQAFTAHVTGWVTFGVSLGALALIALVQLDRERGLVQRLLDVVTGRAMAAGRRLRPPPEKTLSHEKRCCTRTTARTRSTFSIRRTPSSTHSAPASSASTTATSTSSSCSARRRADRRTARSSRFLIAIAA